MKREEARIKRWEKEERITDRERGEIERGALLSVEWSCMAV